jgi:hypothetical protein
MPTCDDETLAVEGLQEVADQRHPATLRTGTVEVPAATDLAFIQAEERAHFAQQVIGGLAFLVAARLGVEIVASSQ